MSDFKFDPKQLEETKAAVDKTLKNFKQAQADCLCMDENGNINVVDTFNRFQAILREVSYSFQSLNDRISYISEAFYQYQQKHLPEVPGPAGMKSALKALGWNHDYDVQPRQVYAALKDGWVKLDGKELKL